MKKNTLVASILLLCASTIHAQLEKNIDSLVSPQFQGNVPGVSILVAKKGQIVYKKAFGNANIELQTPLSPDMIFRIGSITKQFTAVAILQLVEQSKISLQDSIQQYVPFFPPKGHSITIENLLTHTSGIRDYSSKDSPEPFIDRWDFTPEWIINYIKNDSLEFLPGTKYAYSNTNYALLGYIVQKVSGKPYHQYMKENVLQPAGLTQTEYAPENTLVPGRVQGYTRNRGFYENCEYQSLSLGFACGDLLSSVEDLYKWNQVLLSYKLIRKEILKKALTPYKLADGRYSTYGYGWFVDSLWGRPCIHHEGQTSGFIAEEKYFPNEDLYVAVLTNVKSSDDTTDFSDKRFWLFQQIAYVALDIHPKDVTVSETLLQSYTGTYRAAQKHSRTCTITEKDGKLYYSGDTKNPGFTLALAAQSDTVFLLPGIDPYPTTAEFIRENGKVTKFIVTQGGKYEWDRVSP